MRNLCARAISPCRNTAGSANGAGVTAWTALLQGVIADYARTDDSTFANARAASDWDQSGVHRIHPAVVEFRQTGERSFALSYEWRVEETLPRDYNCFVHFVTRGGSGDNISFQNDHVLPRASSTWKAGETLRDGPHDIRLPDDLPDGDYGVRIGLFLPDEERLTLQGRNDGRGRIRAGALHVRDHGRDISFEPEPPAPEGSADIYQHRLNAAARCSTSATCAPTAACSCGAKTANGCCAPCRAQGTSSLN